MNRPKLQSSISFTSAAKFFAVLLALSATSASALALGSSGFFIEPGLQYLSSSGSLTSPYGVANSTPSDYGFGLDLKAGIQVLDIVYAGLDGSISKPQYVDGGNNYSATANLSELGVLVGAQVPIVGLRVWGEYIVSSVLDPAAAPNGLDVLFHNGTGYKVGAGFHLLLISLNLEYENVQYGTTDIQSFGSTTINSAQNSVNLTDKRWIASVSFPFNL